MCWQKIGWILWVTKQTLDGKRTKKNSPSITTGAFYAFSPYVFSVGVFLCDPSILLIRLSFHKEQMEKPEMHRLKILDIPGNWDICSQFHFAIAIRLQRPVAHSNHWTAIRVLTVGRNNFHAAKCDFPAFIEKELEDFAKLSVPNLEEQFHQLSAWHKRQQIGPIFQWQLTVNLWSELGQNKIEYASFAIGKIDE
jgi:hypothetical protein